MDIGMMVEGQAGLTWERWLHILQLAERLRFPSLFRSDHFFTGPSQHDSLDPYLSFAVAARETTTVRFGPLVTPVTFRAPAQVARMAAQVDLLSGGRFVLGLGAGWNEAEHNAYGVPFPAVRERFERLEEAIILSRALWTRSPATFDGRHYQLRDADMLPKPAAGRPPILVGGTGEKRTLLLAARYADEWNAINLNPDQYRDKLAVLERHCDAEGRDPATIRRSMMAFAFVGPDEGTLDAVTRRFMTNFGAPAGAEPRAFREGLKQRGMIVAGRDELIDLLGRFADLGLQEVQLQHLAFDLDDVPEYLAAEIAPAAASL